MSMDLGKGGGDSPGFSNVVGTVEMMMLEKRLAWGGQGTGN